MPDLSDAIQDYLKEIYKLGTESERVSTSALAERQQVSAASASAMVKKLAALGLAEHAPYRGVTLTHAGEQVALEVIRHHRLLELYLAETLGIGIDDVHDEADRLEHALSEELEARIDKALGFPTHDPHGDPIPNANLEWPKEAAVARRGVAGSAEHGPAGAPRAARGRRSRALPGGSRRPGVSGVRRRSARGRKHLFPRERPDVLGRAVVLEHAGVVLERAVRRLERVAELVPLEEVVVAARLAARPVLWVDRATDRPERAFLALEPDHDPLLAPCVVEPLQSPLGAPAVGADPAHLTGGYNRAAMAFRNLFSFLSQRSSAEERVAAYVIREHDRGRDLAEILEDRYVQNRLNPDQRARLLDRPEIIKAIGKDTIQDAREGLGTT